MLLGHVAATPGVSGLQRTLRRVSVTAAHDLTHDTTQHSGDFPLSHQALSPQVIPQGGDCAGPVHRTYTQVWHLRPQTTVS